MLLENGEGVCNGVDMSILKGGEGGVYKGDSCINSIGEGNLWMVQSREFILRNNVYKLNTVKNQLAMQN